MRTDTSRAAQPVGAPTPWLRDVALLMRWSGSRYRYLLPAFTVIQAVFAVAIIVGFAFLLRNPTAAEVQQLASGAWTMGIISVGLVIGPQIIGTEKSEGVLDYIHHLPVRRSAIVVADSSVWAAAALPGLCAGVIAARIRFGLVPTLSWTTLVVVPLALMTCMFLGSAIAHLLRPNVSGVLTQVCLLFALLFAPVTFPADRLPLWLQAANAYLPFEPIANLVRAATISDSHEPAMRDLLVLTVWCAIAYTADVRAVAHRR
ncbi:MAG: ABC transporter permease [Intrasporangium sp.]|uniref:ABC transporter permease n=1 Tax=Intrasporangium sp. TaxID=1925024 RepID=UPI0026470ABB|nr:ABC transporter permease [Intrasporangium sp.]MDN5798133.1 ABC transporter permease [Intrasporangium sp.]